MRKYFLPLLILILLLSLGANYFQYDLLRDKETASEGMKSVLTVEIDQLRAGTVRRDSQIKEMIQKSDSATSANKIVQEASKREIRSLIKRERSQRPDTVKMTLVDTVYKEYDSLITTLANDNDRIQRDCRALVDTLLANANDLQTIAFKTDTLLQVAEKDLRKEKKKGRVWKWLAVVGFGLAIEEAVRN